VTILTDNKIDILCPFRGLPLQNAHKKSGNAVNDLN